jgi:hypothetical protein
MIDRTTTRRPDSDFRYRIVLGYANRRVTWHSLECRTGLSAKHAKRTVHTPEGRREAIEAKYGYKPYYDDYMAKCCVGREAHEKTQQSPVFTNREAAAIFREAQAAGLAAGNAAKPTPMVVGTPTSFLGGEIDYTKRTYYVPDGVCGFAWVTIHPGNSSIARHAKRLGIGSKAYGGGVSIQVWEYGQSMDRKSSHAGAYADVLQKHGVKAYSQSRMD